MIFKKKGTGHNSNSYVLLAAASGLSEDTGCR